MEIKKDQIENMFREAVTSADSNLAEYGDAARYPEECCDAAEISDEDYERWKEGSEKGFWRTFIENR